MKTRHVKMEIVRTDGRVERLEFFTTKPLAEAVEAVARNVETRGLGQVRMKNE